MVLDLSIEKYDTYLACTATETISFYPCCFYYDVCLCPFYNVSRTIKNLVDEFRAVTIRQTFSDREAHWLWIGSFHKLNSKTQKMTFSPRKKALCFVIAQVN